MTVPQVLSGKACAFFRRWKSSYIHRYSGNSKVHTYFAKHVLSPSPLSLTFSFSSHIFFSFALYLSIYLYFFLSFILSFSFPLFSPSFSFTTHPRTYPSPFRSLRFEVSFNGLDSFVPFYYILGKKEWILHKISQHYLSSNNRFANLRESCLHYFI